jgi:hypothetical protein
MKPTALMLCTLLGIATTANAQLSLLPQLGFENSNTSVQVNNGASFSPTGMNRAFKANLRADYRLKKGHGPYVSVGTAPGAIAYSFKDPGIAATNFTTANNPLQLKLEGGYQYTSRPIRLKKTSSKPTTIQQTSISRRCGSSYYYHRQTTATKVKQDKSLALRLQPSVGMAYFPSAEKNIIANENGYQYNAGAYKTAIVSGLGFEFDKGKQRLFTLSIFYSKGIGDLKSKEIPPIENKLGGTYLNSNSSSWGMMVGIPFSLTKTKKIAAAPQPVKTYYDRHRYRSGCTGYRGTCTRKI